MKNTKIAKRILSLLLTVLMVIPMTVSLAVPVSADTVAYAVEGGYIYFDLSTGAIAGCDKSVTKADIPSQINGITVTSIGDWAFYYCGSLTSINIPDGVTSIGDEVFCDCTSLISIVIPDSVTSIGDRAFYNCHSLDKIYYSGTLEQWNQINIGWYSPPLLYADFVFNYQPEDTVVPYAVEGGNIYFDTSTGTVTDADKSITKAVIPDKINGVSVTSIGCETFSWCISLNSLVIPASVNSIGSAAFTFCRSLSSIEVNNENDYYTDVDGVLFNKEKTKLICCCAGTQVTSYTIPDSVTSISDSAFADCITLTSIDIPNGVTSIGDSAFYGCISLKSITIPNGVTSIGNCVFDHCNSLISIKIPDSVTSIDGSAFSDCDSLTSVVISNSIISIGVSAFSDCDSLNKVYYTGTQEQWNEINIGDHNDPLLNAEIVFEVNDITKNDEEIWYDFLSEELYLQYMSGVTNKDDLEYTFYDLNADGTLELLLQERQEFPYDEWTKTWIFALQNGEISLMTSGHHGYGEFSYSAKYNLVITSCPYRPSISYTGKLFYSMSYGSEEYFEVCSSEGIYYYNDCLGQRIITKNEFDSFFENVVWFSFMSIGELPEEEPPSDSEIKVYSDHNDLNIRKDGTMTLSAGLFEDGEQITDISRITFQIEDTSILDVSSTGIENNCRYVKLKAVNNGTTTVVFNDSKTGYSVKVPVTVYDDNYLSFTLNSVPVKYVDKYPTNVYNSNGIYIDSYEYTVNDDQSATVSFDVYNTNYTYAAVEVFDENGNMKDAVLIKKMTSSNTSIKEALWDNIGYLVRDIIDGDLLSYRQESGFSKKTSVEVEIPKDGYIKISTDPKNSFIVGFVNSVDTLMSMASLAGKIEKFDVNSEIFSEKLTKKLLEERVYVELVKEGSGAPEKLWKNVGKEIFISSKSMGDYTETVTKNIDEMNLYGIIADTAESMGWSVGEKAFTYFSGPVGVALNAIFIIGKAENLIIQHNDLVRSAGVGSIYIQNQGGGIRSCQQIKVETEDEFSSDTALNVFKVTLDSDILDLIKDINPGIHETMSNAVTHTYNISLLKNGEETQPNGKVTVYIPIPGDIKSKFISGVGEITGIIKIYRVEEDGSLTEMDVTIENDCFVFVTDHFSLYTIVGYNLEMLNPFTDVDNGKWYTDGIVWCYNNGYMAGLSETVFGRKENVTRAMFVTILAKIDGADTSAYGEMSFTDVKPGQWYSNAIEWAASNGYAAGLGEGIFGYKQNVSREQIALFFYTYSSKNGIDVTAEADLNGYSDLDRVHSWAYDAVSWAVAKGLISGTSATTLSPRDSATRAEIAVIIKNFVENVIR